MVRQPRIKAEQDEFFSLHDTLKKRYPMSDFLKMPEYQKK